MKVRGKRSNQFGQSQWEMMLEAAHTDAPYETQLDAFLKNALDRNFLFRAASTERRLAGRLASGAIRLHANGGIGGRADRRTDPTAGDRTVFVDQVQ